MAGTEVWNIWMRAGVRTFDETFVESLRMLAICFSIKSGDSVWDADDASLWSSSSSYFGTLGRSNSSFSSSLPFIFHPKMLT